MIALRFELSCPRCGAAIDHDTTTAPTVVSLITQDDDETTDPCPDNPSTTDPPN